MNGRAACSCSLCGLEQALIRELEDEETAEQFRLLGRDCPALSGFPTTLSLLHRLRDATIGEDERHASDELLGELLRPEASGGNGLRQRLVLLILMPAVHRTSRQIASGFPSLARDDIAQQLLTSILEILHSKSLPKQQSHFAFTITRLMRRHSFRWAIREARLAPAQELAMPVAAEAVVEGGFETTIYLREFLRGCLDDGQLTATEYDLLMLFKIEGLSAEALAAREGLSEIAFRHRMQRMVDKLRRVAQSPPLGAKRRPDSSTRTTWFRPVGRGTCAA